MTEPCVFVKPFLIRTCRLASAQGPNEGMSMKVNRVSGWCGPSNTVQVASIGVRHTGSEARSSRG